jgi:hypothetical protein
MAWHVHNETHNCFLYCICTDNAVDSNIDKYYPNSDLSGYLPDNLGRRYYMEPARIRSFMKCICICFEFSFEIDDDEEKEEDEEVEVGVEVEVEVEVELEVEEEVEEEEEEEEEVEVEEAEIYSTNIEADGEEASENTKYFSDILVFGSCFMSNGSCWRVLN